MTGHPALTYTVPKRILDVLIAGATLVALAIPMAIIAAAIFFASPKAPIFFRQTRWGRDGRTFRILKFRTMVANADELKEQLRERSSVSWPDFRVENDPRVTRFGRFLRQTSLDELPQLWNVLKGDMTLVGPRPTSFSASTYELWQTGRLDFRPGLTGPWQVHGRQTMGFDERCRLELAFSVVRRYDASCGCWSPLFP